MKRKTYTIHEFLADEHKKELKTIDKMIGHIRRNKKLYAKLVITLALFCFSTQISIATDLSGLDIAGNRVLVIVRRVGYWIILIKGINELIHTAMQGDTNGLGKTIMKYVLIYAALFFMPWALRQVEGVF